MPVEARKYHVKIKRAGSTAVELLAEETGLSKAKIKQAMQKGALWLSDDKGTRRLRRHSKPLAKDTTLHLYYNEDVLQQPVAEALLIADEGDYSVCYKPRGMLSQGSKWGDHTAINRWLEKQLQPQRPVFIVHRLDRFASGLILLAHSKKMATQLSQLFQNGQIDKKYRVLVQGHFQPEHLTIEQAVDSKPACSHVQLLGYNESRDISLVEVKIETGRKHQIRLHLAAAGFPVLGDRLHGNSDNNNKDDLQLTAYFLGFTDPRDGSYREYTLPQELQPAL